VKKAIFFAAAGLLALIVGVGVYLYNSIDPIVKNAIEKYGSEITGTDVSVSSVDISLKSGRGTIRGIRVANPDGFSDDDAFELSEITVDIDVASLNKDPIVIQEVTIAEPVAKAILSARGDTNLGIIKRHVEAYQAGARGSSTGEKGAGYEKRIRILRFRFEEGVLHGDATALGGKTIERALSPVRLENVGGNNGSSPDAIAKEITRAFLNSATDAVKSELRGRATEKLEGEAKKALDKILN